MNREPIGLYIFRFVLGLGLFAFMAMLYWSSVLLEENLRGLRRDLESIKSEMQEIQGAAQQWRSEVSRALLEERRDREELLRSLIQDGARQSSARVEVKRERESEELASADQEKFPNILEKDPFYEITLPKILPAGFQPWGVRKAATIGRPDNLHPFSNWAQVSSWNGLCGLTLATNQFGKFETFAPELATRIERRHNEELQKDEFWIFLREGVYWEPLNPEHFPEDISLAPHFLKRHPVTAHDVKFFWDAMMNPHVQEPGAVSLRNYLGDIEEIRVLDDHRLVVRWKTEKQGDEEKIKYIAQQWTGALRPLPRWVYQYFPDGSKILDEENGPDTYRSNSVWAQNFAEHWARHVIVSCGVWLFDGMTDRKIVFRRNPNHYEPLAALTQEYEIAFKESPDGVWQDFKAGKLDTYELRPDQLIELEDFLVSDEYLEQKKAGKGINRLDYVARSYAYVGWNAASPFFKDREVRQAMTLAIDRNRIIEQNLNGMAVPISGPFYRYSPSYNKKVEPWPFDPRRAQAMLDDAGWYDANGDGIREKRLPDGKTVPFRFGITYYVKNPTTKANADYIATALKEIGVDCQLNGVDIADLSNSFDEKSFDALYLGWSLGTPPEEPQQLWHSAGAKEKGSSNAVGFANSEADRIIESLQYEYQPEKRQQLYHRFHEIIHQEAPYTFLYTPKGVFLYRDYVQNVFIPAERQDLVPGANVAEPAASVFWLKNLEEADKEG